MRTVHLSLNEKRSNNRDLSISEMATISAGLNAHIRDALEFCPDVAGSCDFLNRHSRSPVSCNELYCDIDPRPLDKMTRSWSKTGPIGRIKALCFAAYDHDVGHSYWRRVFLLLLFGRHPLKGLDAGGNNALVLVAGWRHGWFVLKADV